MKQFGFLAFFFFLALPPVFGADEMILLEQSQIVGGGAAKEDLKKGLPTERPALSTTLPWGTQKERTDLDVGQEIFRRLTEPNPSYLAGEDFEFTEAESLQGD